MTEGGRLDESDGSQGGEKGIGVKHISHVGDEETGPLRDHILSHPFGLSTWHK